MGRSSVIKFLADLAPWRDDAACAHDEDPDRWFPDSDDVGGIAELQKVCYECPVRAKCAEYCLKAEVNHGVWAGFYIDPDTLGASRKAVIQWLKGRA
jgi:hypothetical protein